MLQCKGSSDRPFLPYCDNNRKITEITITGKKSNTVINPLLGEVDMAQKLNH